MAGVRLVEISSTVVTLLAFECSPDYVLVGTGFTIGTDPCDTVTAHRAVYTPFLICSGVFSVRALLRTFGKSCLGTDFEVWAERA